jgi:hypothetical protein
MYSNLLKFAGTQISNVRLGTKISHFMEQVHRAARVLVVSEGGIALRPSNVSS